MLIWDGRAKAVRMLIELVFIQLSGDTLGRMWVTAASTLAGSRLGSCWGGPHVMTCNITTALRVKQCTECR